MTDREAIEIMKDIYPSNKQIVTGEYTEIAEAIDEAISALKEREKRARGCGYCTGVVLNVVDETTVFEAGFSYCPRCGRKLKEEPNGVD